MTTNKRIEHILRMITDNSILSDRVSVEEKELLKEDFKTILENNIEKIIKQEVSGLVAIGYRRRV